jgi:hypothetical protein
MPLHAVRAKLIEMPKPGQSSRQRIPGTSERRTYLMERIAQSAILIRGLDEAIDRDARELRRDYAVPEESKPK